MRSDRVWRLPHVLVPGRAGFATCGPLVAAFEQRLGTRPWLLRQIRFVDDEAAELREVVYELELLDQGWAAPAHGRWIGRRELAHLRLADEAHREVLDRCLGSLERGVTLHHAVSYQHIVAGLEPAARRELDVTHEFLREALAGARAWPVV